MSKAVWDEGAGAWRIWDTICPNWTPDEVKLPKNCADILGSKKFRGWIYKKEKNMLNEDQKKVVEAQLVAKATELSKSVESWTRQMAAIGKRLHDAVKELDEVSEVLEQLNPDHCDCDE